MAKNNDVKYEVSGVYKKKDILTMMNGQHVNVTGGEVKVSGRARKNQPAKDYVYAASTEDIRKWWWEVNLLRGEDGKPITDAEGNEISNQKAIKKINVNTATVPSDK